jgi:CO dehydrogenase maturation factor
VGHVGLMGVTIAVAGKGGVGKTSVAALLIEDLARRGPVLAIDADPSANLNQALGLGVRVTVGDIRENLDEALRQGTFKAGLTKKDWLDFKVQEALLETDRVDLLVMGRPEGPGCYCAVNNMLRAIIDRIAGRYAYVVIDTEAGMEHLSRQTTRDVDHLLIISDPSRRGLTAAAGIKRLITQIRSNVGPTALVVNRVARELPEAVRHFAEEHGLEPMFTVGEDGEVYDLDLAGRPLTDLGADSVLRRGVERVIASLDLGGVNQ